MSRLYRSRTDRMFAGVAGGLAERLEADPALVRIAWAVLVFVTGGVALLVYIIMAFVVPEGAAGTPDNPGDGPLARPVSERGTTLVFGLGLVLVGSALLLERLIPSLDLGDIWPLVLIVLGGAILFRSIRRAG